LEKRHMIPYKFSKKNRTHTQILSNLTHNICDVHSYIDDGHLI
jgi:hypothetical protein